MFTSSITPVVLTYNEALNIKRCLEKLRWAREVVVIDSYSEDETVILARGFTNVKIVQRKFDNFENQWNYGIAQADIKTPWILALDADYILSDAFIGELEPLQLEKEVCGFRAEFIYCIGGEPLRASLYPPVTVLFKRGESTYKQDGHAYRLECNGVIRNLKSPIYHDDRKPFMRWLRNQRKYAEEEAGKIQAMPFYHLCMSDKIRALRVIAPLIVGLYCLFYKGLIFEGRPGFRYCAERVAAEALLSWELVRADFKYLKRLGSGKKDLPPACGS